VPVNVSAAVEAAANGDRAAWSALVDRFTPLVWATVRAHRLSDADAADVVQTTWLRLVEHLERITDPERVGAWLATTARRESLRVIAGGARVTPTEALDDVADRTPGPAQAVALQERDATLWRALDRLGDRCRALLRLLVNDPPPSYDEISAAMDMPVGSIGPTRARCLARLRDEIETLGINGVV
jgi:RNA polymerase sigma factor (sigma-70 family)